MLLIPDVSSLIKSEFCIFNVTVSPGTITTIVILKNIVGFLLISGKFSRTRKREPYLGLLQLYQ